MDDVIIDHAPNGAVYLRIGRAVVMMSEDELDEVLRRGIAYRARRPHGTECRQIGVGCLEVTCG